MASTETTGYGGLFTNQWMKVPAPYLAFSDTTPEGVLGHLIVASLSLGSFFGLYWYQREGIGYFSDARLE